MRVISGSVRGKRLFSLDGDDTRPTLDRVKESVFNIIQFEVEDSRVLDLFSGSGQLGIEAISRGAKMAYCCDSGRQACEIIKKNIKLCGFEDKITLVCGDYKSISSYKNSFKAFDMVFLDPPYHKGLIEKALVFMTESGILSEKCVIIAESARDEVLPERVNDFISTKAYNYGSVKITLYRRAEPEE